VNPGSNWPYRGRDLTWLAVVAACYGALAWAVLKFLSSDGLIAVFWPGAGVALAALLLGGMRYWIAIFIPAFVGALLLGQSVAQAVMLGVAATSGPLLGYWLLARLPDFDCGLGSPGDFFRLCVLAGLLSSGVSALVGAATLYAFGTIPADALGVGMIDWWLGDILGIILVAPLVLVWRHPPRLAAAKAIEGTLILGLAFVAGQAIFLDWPLPAPAEFQRGFWMYLFVIFAAVRLGTHGVLPLLLVTTTQGLLGATRGVGYFATQSGAPHRVDFWVFATVLAFVGVSLATLLAARRSAALVLQRREQELKRTQQLAGLGGWSWDMGSGAQRWSEAVYRIFGRDSDLPPVAYPEVRQYFSGDGWQRFSTAVEATRSRGVPYEIDADLVLPGGDRRWIVARGEAVRDEHGRIVEMLGTIQDITERKQAEEARRESEERLHLFIQHAPAALAMFDRDMRYIAVSRRWLSDYSLGDRDVVGRSHYDIFPEIPDRWRAVHRRGLAGEVVEMEQDPFERADGSVQWLRWAVRPWHRADGGIGGIVIFTEDITARKQAELALAEQEGQYRAVLETTADGFWMIGPDARIRRTNEAYARQSGYSRAELIGKPAAELEAVESPEELARHVAAIRSEGSEVFETWHRRKSGELWPVEVTAAYSAEAGGVYFAFLRDITERKRAADALRASEARFRATFEQAAVGIAHVAPDGRWLRVNGKLCEILGYCQAELLTMKVRDITHPDDIETDLAYVRRVLAGEMQNFSREKRYIRKDGAVIWINLTLALARKPGGAPDYFITVVEDISQRKRTEAALQALHGEMENLTKFQVAGQTAAALAHELNQPLNAVASYAEAALRLLRAGNPQPEKLRHALESSSQQAQRAGRVVRELLAFMNQGQVQVEPMDLNDAVQKALNRIAADGFAGFAVHLDLFPELSRVNANRLQVEKVLVNLIENSIEAMRESGLGKLAIAVTVRTNADADMAQVTVSDNGPGIDSQTLHRVFDPFFTTKPKGLGMGLAISRSIIEAHGGRLWVESEPGAGASFHFTLPLVP
jgi:PAS domain S-box-containing protein